MRSIKFKAWDEKNKVMHHDFQFICSGNEGNDFIVFVSDKEKQKANLDQIIFNNPYFRKQLKIMQYICRRDKNGIEIYEGDIVMLYGMVLKVVYDPAIFRLADKNGLFYGSGFPDWDCCEVIGNIYENNDLLELTK